MIKLQYPATSVGPDRVLLIMLPGAGIAAGGFAANGLVAAALARQVVVIAVEPSLELYLDGEIAAALYREVIAPARADGYRRIWLLGISLGAMGALLTISAHEDLIEGVILLAPFLGTKGTIAELENIGGLTQWSAQNSAASDVEQTMLLWLQKFIARRPAAPALYLGFGEADRFAPGHRLLAQHLPPADVVTTKGGHDWASWVEIFHDLLLAEPFSARRKLDDTGRRRIP